MDRGMRVSLLWVLVAIVCLALSGCGPTPTEEPTGPPPATEVAPEDVSTETAEPVEEEPVVLRVGDVRALDCWNPFTCANFYNWYGLVLGDLMHAGPDEPSCAPVPYHAKSWQVSDDGLTWTFELYDDATFSDGVPLNASAIKDMIEWWAASDLAVWQPSTLHVQSVEAPDENTLVLTTDVPIGTFESYDHHWLYLIPYHIWSKVDPAELWTWENYPPIGSGPYVVTDYRQGEYIVLDAREDFHLGKPPVDRIVIQYYANWDAVVQAFLAGEIDVTGSSVPAAYYDTLASASNTTIVENPGLGSFILSLNSWDGEGGNRHPAIADTAVRYAIDSAIDKDQLVEVLLLGHGETCPVAHVCDPPMTGMVNPELEVTPFDLEKARGLLDDAGYADGDGDGIRETPDGQPLEFRLFYDVYFPELTAASDMIQDWLSEIGIAVSPEAMELGTLNQNLKVAHDFDLGIYYADFDIDPLNMDFSYTCWSAESGVGNRSGYCSPEFDEMLTKYVTTADRTEATGYLWQAQAIAFEDRPFVVLASKNSIQAYNSQRFVFGAKACPAGTAGPGVWGFPNIMEAEVK